MCHIACTLTRRILISNDLRSHLLHIQAIAVILMVFSYGGNCVSGHECAIKDAETIHVKCVTNGHVQIHVPEELGLFTPHLRPQEMIVKRIHSRQRRFIAPGASWQIRVGAATAAEQIYYSSRP